MSLTKAGIFQSATHNTNVPKQACQDAVGQFIEITKVTLVGDEDILISDFGEFCMREKSELRGRNSANGDAMMLSARRVVTFKYSGKLRSRHHGGCN